MAAEQVSIGASLQPVGCAAAGQVRMVHGLIKRWIESAREACAAGSDEMPTDKDDAANLRLPFGALELGGEGMATLQVEVHFKLLCRRRCIMLHFGPRLDARNVKEAGFIYFGAARGTLTGIHVAPERRGGGEMK